MADLAIVVLIAAGTFAMRASMVTLLANITIPLRVGQALGLVVPAVIAGLVAQTLFLDGGDLRPLGTWYVAASVAALAAWRTRSFAWPLVVGMGAVWALEALV